MKRACACLFLLSLFYSTYGQYENVWVFGSYHGGLDFNYDPPRFFESAIEGFGEGCAMVCDENGALLFYTEGTRIWNKNHQLMPDGGNILPITSTNNYSPSSSTAQGALIVKKPFSAHQYYVFSLASAEQYLSVENFERTRNFGRLYYSVVDMQLNNGLGDVIPNQAGIAMDSFLYEHMTVVPGTGCWLWVVVLSRTDNALKAYRIDHAGVAANPVTSPLNLHLQTEPIGGTQTYHHMSWVGTITSNHQHNQLVITDMENPVDSLRAFYLVDFDNATGIASHARMIDSGEAFYGACFSPNDSLLYVGSNRGLYQYSLYPNTPQAIRQSRFWVGSGGYALKMGQGEKVYSVRSSGMSRINAPNAKQVGCAYEQLAVPVPDSLNMFLHIGLPNTVGVLDTGKVRRQVNVFHYDSDCFLPLSLEPSYGGTKNAITWMDTIASPTLTVRMSGVYWVTYHDYAHCTTFTDSFYVSIPTYTIHTRPACTNAPNGMAWVEVSDSDGAHPYHWLWLNSHKDTLATGDTLKGAPSGSYTLTLRDTGCAPSVDVEIDAITDSVSFVSSDTILCQGDSVHFHNTSDSHFTDFVWAFGDQDRVVAESPTHTYLQHGAYPVTLIGTGAICTDSATAMIIVDSLLPGAFQVAPDEVCVGRPVRLYPLIDSSATGLRWVFSEADAREAMSRTSRYQHTFDRAGVMPITLYAQFRACPDTSFTDSITVYPLPEVDLGGDSSICLHGAPVYLKNLREAPLNPPHYLWSTGDTTPILKVVHPGTYTLRVATEPIGCTTTESIEITKNCYIDIPNAFTPNGDRHNDYFFPRQLLSESISRFRMQVFNRWGQLLFETGNLDGRGWDGRFNGKDQPVGVYLYRIEADFSNGRQEQYEGNVTLVR